MLTSHRLSAPGLYMKRIAAHMEVFCIRLELLLKDTGTHDGCSFVQVLLLILSSLQLCSKLTSN